MPRLIWGAVGERYFETGVDRGVLYVDDSGVPWNGLISVSESPSGGEPRSFYNDGVKVLQVPSKEEFEATIRAYSSPKEFAQCEGVGNVRPGLSAGQQRKRAFGLSYRTKIGNDTEGTDHAYKLHIIYNALATPAKKEYTTFSDSPELIELEWNLTTLPRTLVGNSPTSHITIDSRTTPAGLLRAIEDILYGSNLASARMIYPSELLAMFDSPGPIVRVNYNVISMIVLDGGTVLSTGIGELDGGAPDIENLVVIDGGTPATSFSATDATAIDGGTSVGSSSEIVDAGTVTEPDDGTTIDGGDPTDSGAGDNVDGGSSTIYIFSEPAQHVFDIGETVTVSATVLIPAGMHYQVYIHASTGNYFYPGGAAVSYVSDGNPVRVSRTETLTRQESDIKIAVLADKSSDPNATYYMIDVLIEKSPYALPYFDGDTPDANGVTYEWMGVPNASESIARSWA